MKNIIQLGFSGEYSFPPYQKYGPAVRSCNIIHLVLSGKGYLTASGKVHEITGGRAFIIYEGEKIEYHADKADPWSYVWIDFSGEASESLLSKTGFSEENRVTPPLDTESLLPLFKRLRVSAVTDSEKLMRVCALFELIAEISKSFPSEGQNNSKEGVAELARRLINKNFTNAECRVEKIAEIIDISRSQLYRAFMDKYGVSPKAYIDSLRIDYAKKLLSQKEMSVAEVSYSIGLGEPLYFSTSFRKAVGLSPTEYKNKCKENA